VADKIRIAQMRLMPVKGDLAGNQARLMPVLEEIGGLHPDVVITSEAYLDGYVVTEEYATRENLAQWAIDPATSPYTRAASDWAREHNAWLVYGCSRLGAGGVHNSALIYDRVGRLYGVYDKLHIQTQDHKYAAGSVLPVFQSDFGPFGCLICADRRWPEAVRSLALQGARLILNPHLRLCNDLNLAMMRTRSFESEVFIAFTHPQQSLVTGPGGEILLDERSEAPAYSLTELDLARVDEIRAKPENHLKDRRPDVYCM